MIFKMLFVWKIVDPEYTTQKSDSTMRVREPKTEECKLKNGNLSGQNENTKNK